MQFFFHGRVAQVPPQLQAVDAQHRLHGKRWASAQRLVRAAYMRLDQPHQRRPRHHPVHLLQEDLLARLLGQGIKPQHLLLLRHGRHLACASRQLPVGSGVLQTFPSNLPVVAEETKKHVFPLCFFSIAHCNALHNGNMSARCGIATRPPG